MRQVFKSVPCEFMPGFVRSECGVAKTAFAERSLYNLFFYSGPLPGIILVVFGKRLDHM